MAFMDIPDEATRPAIPSRKVHRITEEQEAKERLAREIAAKTLFDIRTIRKYLNGDPILASTRQAISAVMKSL